MSSGGAGGAGDAGGAGGAQQPLTGPAKVLHPL